MRLKLIANNTTVERRFSSWIGGSILASLVSKPVTMLCSTVTHKLNSTYVCIEEFLCYWSNNYLCVSDNPNLICLLFLMARCRPEIWYIKNNTHAVYNESCKPIPSSHAWTLLSELLSIGKVCGDSFRSIRKGNWNQLLLLQLAIFSSITSAMKVKGKRLWSMWSHSSYIIWLACFSFYENLIFHLTLISFSVAVLFL